MANKTTWTQKKEDTFLSVLRNGLSITAACQQAGLTRSLVYVWRKEDAEFAAAWDDAVEMGIDRLEDEAYRRAHDGVQKPVFHQGEICGHIREFSDTLLIFTLKAKRRARYGDRQEIGGIDGAPIEIADVTSEERRKAALALLLTRQDKRNG